MLNATHNAPLPYTSAPTCLIKINNNSIKNNIFGPFTLKLFVLHSKYNSCYKPNNKYCKQFHFVPFVCYKGRFHILKNTFAVCRLSLWVA